MLPISHSNVTPEKNLFLKCRFQSLEGSRLPFVIKSLPPTPANWDLCRVSDIAKAMVLVQKGAISELWKSNCNKAQLELLNIAIKPQKIWILVGFPNCAIRGATGMSPIDLPRPFLGGALAFLALSSTFERCEIIPTHVASLICSLGWGWDCRWCPWSRWLKPRPPLFRHLRSSACSPTSPWGHPRSVAGWELSMSFWHTSSSLSPLLLCRPCYHRPSPLHGVPAQGSLPAYLWSAALMKGLPTIRHTSWIGHVKVPLPPLEGFLDFVIHLLHGEFLPLDLLLHELVHSNVATGLLKELFVQAKHTFSRCLLHDHTIEAGALVQIEQRFGAGIGVANKDHPRKSVSGVLIGQRVCPVKSLHWVAFEELFKLIHQHDGGLGGNG